MRKYVSHLVGVLAICTHVACGNKNSVSKIPEQANNICSGLIFNPIVLDTSIDHSEKLYHSANKKSTPFSVFKMVSTELVSYNGLVLSKSMFVLDSLNVFLLRREDEEPDSTMRLCNDLCFNKPADSLNLFNNYNQLLISFPNTGYASVGSDQVDEWVVESIVKSGNLAILNVIGAGTTGSSINFSHIFIFENEENYKIILHQPIYKSKESTAWLK